MIYAQGEKVFIAQEFCESINFLAPNRSNQWTPHILVWRAFGFGEDYGGVWGRMSEVNTSSGGINSATGAVEIIVYEYTASTSHNPKNDLSGSVT